MTYNPLYLSALSGIASCHSGTASGIVNTSLLMGGALGLSFVAGIAAARTEALLVSGVGLQLALNDGLPDCFLYRRSFTVLAALISGLLLRDRQQSQRNDENIGAEIPRVICDDAHS